MGAGAWCLRGEPVALLLEALHVSVDVVRAKAQVVDAGATLFQVLDQRTLTIKRVNQFYRCSINGKERCRCLRRFDILCSFERQPEVTEESVDGSLKIRNCNRYMIQRYYHGGASLFKSCV
jgi:hypothetical protein